MAQHRIPPSPIDIVPHLFQEHVEQEFRVQGTTVGLGVELHGEVGQVAVDDACASAMQPNYVYPSNSPSPPHHHQAAAHLRWSGRWR